MFFKNLNSVPPLFCYPSLITHSTASWKLIKCGPSLDMHPTDCCNTQYCRILSWCACLKGLYFKVLYLSFDWTTESRSKPAHFHAPWLWFKWSTAHSNGHRLWMEWTGYSFMSTGSDTAVQQPITQMLMHNPRWAHVFVHLHILHHIVSHCVKPCWKQ